MDCYETARQYTVLRKQFDDRPIASHQLVQEKLADMITEITKAQLLALQCGRLKDQGGWSFGARVDVQEKQRPMAGPSNARGRAGICWERMGTRRMSIRSSAASV